MTFGYLFDFRNPPKWHRKPTDLYAQMLDFVPYTEQLGFEKVWLPEHHVAEDGYLPSPLIMMAAFAARTKTLAIGSAVALTAFYHPVRFAEDCSILDIISDGRIELALALGYRKRETDAYGLDFRTRGGRMTEFLEIVRRLWDGETFSYEGKHFNLTNAAVSPLGPRGQIPLFIGGFSDKAMQRAARFGDGYFGNVEVFETYREKLRECGKDAANARIYVQDLFTLVADDPEKALHELAPYFHHVNNSYGQWLNEDKYDNMIQVDVHPEEMSLETFKAQGMLKVLTPDQAIDHFKAMRAKAPVEHVMLAIPPGLPVAEFAPYAETFATKVMPACAELD
jgi:alkanesulfonate monooxygenase SsuD/methylene tetrahydromethanopterin reductase-like flavin-dependent oxidoreductase (luciferase family)